MKNPCLCVFVARYNGGDWFVFFLLSFSREAVHVVHPSWTVRFFRLVLWPLASDEFWDYFHSHERIELLICKSCGVVVLVSEGARAFSAQYSSQSSEY